MRWQCDNEKCLKNCLLETDEKPNYCPHGNVEVNWVDECKHPYIMSYLNGDKAGTTRCLTCKRRIETNNYKD